MPGTRMKREIRKMIQEMVAYELENSDEDVIYSLAEDTLYQWYERQTENHIKNLYANRVYEIENYEDHRDKDSG